MGLLTLSDLRNAAHLGLKQRSDADPTDAGAGEALWNRWVNDAYRYVCLPSVYRHPGMQASDTVTLVDGTTSYSMTGFSPSLYAIEFVINEDKEDRYSPMQDRELLDRPGGSPRRWARRGNALLIRADSSVDGDTVRVYYWARPDLLSDDADTTDIEEFWDQVIWRFAAGFAATNLGMMETADYFNSAAAALTNDHREPGHFEAQDRGWRNSPIPMTSYGRVR